MRATNSSRRQAYGFCCYLCHRKTVQCYLCNNDLCLLTLFSLTFRTEPLSLIGHTKGKKSRHDSSVIIPSLLLFSEFGRSIQARSYPSTTKEEAVHTKTRITHRVLLQVIPLRRPAHWLGLRHHDSFP